MTPGDAELVRGIRRGDRDSAAQLAERYLAPARTVALAILNERAAAEDVAQDAFVYAIERIDDCRQPDRFGAWLMQIVRNRSRNHLRDNRPERNVPVDEIDLRSSRPSPEREAERSELRDRLQAALAQVDEDHRTVLLLHDLEGWKHAEIARHLGIPPGTARSHLHHARKKLRAILHELNEAE